jgi:hypothetical protein
MNTFERNFAPQLGPGPKPQPALATCEALLPEKLPAPASTSPLAVGCAPSLACVPGEPAELRLAVRNDSGEPLLARVKLAGVPTSWVTRAPLIGPLPPGEVGNATLCFVLPPGSPPGRLTLGVQAIPLKPTNISLAGRPGWAEFFLTVEEAGLVEVSLPEQVLGTWRGHFEVTIHNHGRSPQPLSLSAWSPSGARVSFSVSSIELGGGQTRVLRASVRKGRSLVGAPRRTPFSVEARGRGVKTGATATFVQSPWLQAWAVRAIGLVITLVAFATLATFVVVRLSTTYAPKLTQPPALKPAPATAAYHAVSPQKASELPKRR